MAQNPGTSSANGFGPQQKGPFPPAPSLMPGLSGLPDPGQQAMLDPHTQQMVQDALQNPHNDQFGNSPNAKKAQFGASGAGQQQQAANGKDGDEKPNWGGPQVPIISTFAGGATVGELGIATVAGVGLGLGASWAYGGGERALKVATALEKIPGVGHLSRALNGIEAPSKLSQRDWWQYRNSFIGHGENWAKLSSDDQLQRMINYSEAHQTKLVHRNVAGLLKPRRNLLTPWKKTDLGETYRKVLSELPNKNSVPDLTKLDIHNKSIVDVDKGHYHQQLLDGLKDPVDHLEKKASTGKLSGEEKSLLNRLKGFHENLHGGVRGYNFMVSNDIASQHINAIDKHIRESKPSSEEKAALLKQKEEFQEIKKYSALEEKRKLGHLSPSEYKDLADFKRLHANSMGVAGNNIREMSRLNLQLHNQGVGTIGRSYTKTLHYLKGILGGEQMTLSGVSGVKNGGMAKMGAAMAKSLPALLIGSLASAAMVIAPAIHASNQADKGDKKATFWENFIGFGIFNFIGWEVGRRFLASTGIMHRILGRNAARHPFRAVSWLPFIGEKLGKKVGKSHATAGKILGNHALGRWFGKTSLVALSTELLAMFGFGQLFQSGGEWLSHQIFGKPTKKEDKPPLQAAPGAVLTQANSMKNRLPDAATLAAQGVNGLPPGAVVASRKGQAPNMSGASVPPSGAADSAFGTPDFPPPAYSATPGQLGDMSSPPPSYTSLTDNPLSVANPAASPFPQGAGFTSAGSAGMRASRTPTAPSNILQQPIMTNLSAMGGPNPFSATLGSKSGGGAIPGLGMSDPVPNTVEQLLQDPTYRRSASFASQPQAAGGGF